jgi:hypothetical protein
VFKAGRIREKLLYEIWKSNGFETQLKTVDDQEIEIIDAGENNKNFAGPDFFNSKVKIGNLKYYGDVEIDVWHSDWKSHGHYLDKKYNKVILHVVLSKERFQPYVFTQDGRKVNSICLTDFISDSYQTSVRKAIQSEKSNRIFVMPCSELNKGVLPNEKLKYLSDLVLERLKEMIYFKKNNIREPIVRYDFGEEFQNKKFSIEEFNEPVIWQQLVYEMIFEALGYSKNKDIMLKLAKAVNIDFLKTYCDEPDFDEIIECALFNVSGIISQDISTSDEETSEYLRKLVERWSLIKNQYDGTYFKKEKWNFFKLRPQNFPTVRIAGGSRIVKRLIISDFLNKLVESFSQDENQKKITSVLRNLTIVKASGFWRKHFVFDKPAKGEVNYFIGLSRADEIIINVLFPVLAVFFEIFQNKEANRSVKNLYLNYHQKSTNQVVIQVENSLHLENCGSKSVHIQGMIDLFRHYCVKERCLECTIGKSVFK